MSVRPSTKNVRLILPRCAFHTAGVMVESIMGRLFIWNLRSPAGAAPAPPAFAMMVGKKSLGVHCHCWSEKGEVIVRQEREKESAPHQRWQASVSHRMGAPQSRRGAWEQRWGLARDASLCLCCFFWLGVGSRSVTFLHFSTIAKVPYVVTLAHQME